MTAGPLAGMSGDASQRSERLIIRAFALIRVFTLAQAAVALIIDWPRYRWPGLVAGLLVAAAAESLLVIRLCRRRNTVVYGPVLATDAVATIVFLVVAGLALTGSGNPITDDVFYPYSVAAMALVGFGSRRWLTVVLVPAVTAGTYIAVASIRFGFGFSLVENSATYWAFAVIGWALAWKLRELSHELDRARADAVSRARELAQARHQRELQDVQLAAVQAELDRETERTRIFRALHDNVLQTLEFIARHDRATYAQLRDRVAAEAAWLRSLLQGGTAEATADAAAPDADLAAALAGVAQRHLATGLHVELNTAAMAGARPVCPAVTQALAGAVNEALTNVRKHAGTSEATVRAAPAAGEVVVTVLDHGCGFDACARRPAGPGGLGLPAIHDRMREAGGTAVVSSAPGEGTHVELRVPAP
jgi:signal transduction histidine kinase